MIRPWRGSCRMVLMNVVKKMCTSSTLPAMYSSIKVFTGPTMRSRCGRSPSWTTLDTTLPPIRCRKPSPLLPIAT